MSLHSVPEPPPRECGIIVPDALLEYMEGINEWEDLSKLVRERDAFGRKKYGQPLMSQDGRNGVEDARQEAGDLLQYAFKVYLSGDVKGLDELRLLIKQVDDVMGAICHTAKHSKH
jgi:hypothetical protein